MLILLSPAKKLDYETPATIAHYTQPDLLDDAEYLINKLKKLSSRQLANMMKISPSLAHLNHQRYQGFYTPFTLQNAKQALLVFKGEVYMGLDAQTLTEAELLYTQNHLRILSGLYGLLKPLDLIQPYRLEMGSRFSVTAKKTNLYLYWGNRITEAVNKALKAQGDDVLINLASNEYFKAAKDSKLLGHIITPTFMDLKNGQYKPIFLWVKQARGMMARYIIENTLSDPEQIKEFDKKGYRYNAEMSTSTRWVFTRDEVQ
ncbi:MAG: peroxide stress protein YaaA [Pseudomonadota bacterium]